MREINDSVNNMTHPMWWIPALLLRRWHQDNAPSTKFIREGLSKTGRWYAIIFDGIMNGGPQKGCGRWIKCRSLDSRHHRSADKKSWSVIS